MVVIDSSTEGSDNFLFTLRTTYRPYLATCLSRWSVSVNDQRTCSIEQQQQPLIVVALCSLQIEENENPVCWEKLIFRSLRKDFRRRSSHVSNVVEVRCLFRKLVPRLPSERTSLEIAHHLWPLFCRPCEIFADVKTNMWE